MKLVINKDRSVISVGTWGTVNENNYEILDFEFPAELEEYNKRIVYYLDDQRVWDAIVDNKAIITNAITTKEHVKAYVWLTKTDSQYETDVDFRTQLFEMNFYENKNADGIVPTEEQVDGFNTMLTAMNAKIDEVDALEQTIETAEAQRQEAEATRVSNENTRESNESTRQTNEQTRQLQETERERRTDEAIADIEDKTAEYNANAEAKTTAFNNNATQKTNEFNSNYTQKVNDFNTNATTQKTDFNTNASSKTSAFNSNAETKTNTFNTNATNKTNAFNSNATEKTTTFNDNASTKTSEFNTNAESKTSAFNDNATQKTTNFDNNASEKTDEFNTNAQNKIDEYDEHIVEYQAQIDELQEEVEELSENMPWNNTEQATEIQVTDAAKYSKNKLELFGNTEQAENPSPDNPQPIHVVTGNNSVGVQGKNLFKYSDYEKLALTGVTVSNTTNNSFRISGKFAWSNIALSYKLKKNTNYVISSKNTCNIETKTGVTILGTNVKEYTSSDVTTISAATYTTLSPNVASDITKTFNSGDYEYIVFRFVNNGSASSLSENTDMLVDQIQLEEGQVQTSFEPYTHADYPLYLNPNNLYHNVNTILGKRLDTGGILFSDAAYFTSDYIEVEENENYIVNYTPTVYTRICYYNSSKNYLSRNETDATFTTPANTKYIRLCNTIKNINKVQLEKGTTLTEGIDLCKIGDYQDYFYKENGNWYKYGAINKVILDGTTERWGGVSTSGNFKRIDLRDTGLLNEGTSRKTHLFCSISRASIVEDYNIAFNYSDKIFFYLPQGITTGNEWVALLSQKLPKLYYILATPITTQITDETLIAQLDEICEHLKLIKGTNNITVTTEDLAPYMKLTYMQDIKSKLDNLDSRLALLE